MEYRKPAEARQIEARSRSKRLRVRLHTVEHAKCYWTPSQSEDDLLYHLTRDRNGWQCECPGYLYTGVCKHLGALERRADREDWDFGLIAPLPKEARA